MEKERADKEQEMKNSMAANNRFKSNPEYLTNFQSELNRRKDEYSRMLEMEQKVKDLGWDRK